MMTEFKKMVSIPFS